MKTRLCLCASIIAASLIGCAAPQKKDLITDAPSSPLRQLAFNEAINLINQQAEQVTAIKADTQIEIKSNLLKEPQSCYGKMMLVRPDKIRLKGFQPFVPTLFDIASNGKRFWFYVPQDKKVYTGEYNEQGETPVKLDIDPFNLIAALTFEKVGGTADRDVIFLEKIGDSCVVNVVEKRVGKTGHRRFYLRRKIFINIESRKISKEQYFKNDGDLSFEVYYDKYAAAGDTVFPQQIVFVRPKTRTQVIINILKSSFNQTFSEDVFSLENLSNVEKVEVGS
jgi:outer membrane lipoprotein-sorting protein